MSNPSINNGDSFLRNFRDEYFINETITYNI